MPVAVTEIARDTFGGRLKAVLAEVTFDTTYPSGGEAVTAADFALTEITAVFADAANEGTTGANVVKFDRANKKLILFETGDAVSTDLDQQNTADQSAKKTVVLVLGF